MTRGRQHGLSQSALQALESPAKKCLGRHDVAPPAKMPPCVNTGTVPMFIDKLHSILLTNCTVDDMLYKGYKMNRVYLKRIVDEELSLLLEAKGAVLIEGPKWCGKTRTAEEQAKSVLYMQDPDESEQNMLKANTKPSLLLEGETPRLLDEWQVAPVIWNAVRFAVDKRRSRGQFILTGSVIPERAEDMHTGTGRIARMKMRTMSLFESLESTGAVSLSKLFDGETEMEGKSNISVEQYAFIINRGGWPESVGHKNERLTLAIAKDYLEAVANEDISRADGIEKNPDRVKSLMASLARNISGEAKTSTIFYDLSANDESLSRTTIEQYIAALKRIFVIEDLPAWSARLRSKTAIRTSAKRHFVDPSIAAAALRATPKRLLDDFKTFGFLFESLAIRDLRVYAASIDGKVYHYRDKSGMEIDAIIQLGDGRWGAVEVKMGAGMIEEAVQNLLALQKKVDTEKIGKPSFLIVLTATEYAMRLKNGIWVIPLGCLKN